MYQEKIPFLCRGPFSKDSARGGGGGLNPQKGEKTKTWLDKLQKKSARRKDSGGSMGGKRSNRELGVPQGGAWVLGNHDGRKEKGLLNKKKKGERKRKWKSQKKKKEKNPQNLPRFQRQGDPPQEKTYLLGVVFPKRSSDKTPGPIGGGTGKVFSKERGIQGRTTKELDRH